MNWFRRLIARLNPPPVSAAPAKPPNEAEWLTALELTRVKAYQAGFVEGELHGRLQLANEIEAEFMAAPITEADARRIRQRQIH